RLLGQGDQVLALNVAVPVTVAGGRGTRPSSESTLTLLPLPDSPTMASVSPGATDHDTPLTARAGPRRVAMLTRRSSTASTGSAGISPLPSPTRWPSAAAGRARPAGRRRSR